jgi:molybdopterin-guanine dinucleotide biosynthesis protein A
VGGDERARSGKTAQTVGYVLAGGGSTRFGRDKALVEISGAPMLLRMRALLAEVLPEVKVIAPPERYAALGVTGIADRWDGQGPLAGIITALRTTQEYGDRAEWNLIVGCDMPFLTREWLDYLVVRAQGSREEVVVPRSENGLEPLCACWRSGAAVDTLQRAFESGTRKVTEAMKQLKMEIVDETDGKRFDSGGRLFWNMNTAADYEQAIRYIEGGRT